MEEKKLSFLKKIKTSILNFDGYQDLAAEKVGRTIAYIVILMLIFGLIISLLYTFKFYEITNKIKEYIGTNISNITYKDYKLEIDTNDGQALTEIDTNEMIPIKIIINTKAEKQEKIQESIKKKKKTENGILFLKDKVVVKTGMSSNLIEYTYKTISEKYNINKIDKNEVLSMLSNQQIIKFLITFFLTVTLYMFIVYVSSVLIDIFLLAILTYIVARISGLRLKYSAIYNIATYSLTLPIILNIIYFVANFLTGFTIKYFQIMYTAIASIYIITAILMIKSDVIKRQLELNRIIEEQERVKQELKRQEEENKEKEEQKRREEKERKKEENEKKKQEKDKQEGGIGKEPEGDNA